MSGLGEHLLCVACLVLSVSAFSSQCQLTELLFVVDTSSSIGLTNFDKAISLFRELLIPDVEVEGETCWREDCFGPGGISVGALTYADYTGYQMPLAARSFEQTILTLSDLKYKTVSADKVHREYSRPARADTTLLEGRPLGEYTQADAALKHARSILTSTNTGARQMVVLLSDGLPRYRSPNASLAAAQLEVLFEQTKTEATLLRQSNIVTMMVGIAEYDLGNLELFAGSPDRAFTAESFDLLSVLQNELSSSITSRVCAQVFEVVKPVPAQCEETEIVLVLDTSSSIGFEAFADTLAFFKTVFALAEDVTDPCWRAECFGLGGISVGALTYADYTAYQMPLGPRSFRGTFHSLTDLRYKNVSADQVHTEFSRPARGNASFLQDRPLGEYTQADAALKHARTILEATKSGARQLVIFISDGLPRYRAPDDSLADDQLQDLYDATLAETNALRSNGVLTMGMAIASFDLANLQQLAGSLGHTFTSDVFDSGLSEVLATAITDAMCFGGVPVQATKYGEGTSCKAQADCWYSTSSSDCSRLAVAMGLDDDESAVTTSFLRPQGCYYNPRSSAGNKLWFNRGESDVECSEKHKCVCECNHPAIYVEDVGDSNTAAAATTSAASAALFTVALF